MELLSELWDKTTDALHGAVGGGLRRPDPALRQLQRAADPPDAADRGPDQRARAGDAGPLATRSCKAKTAEFRRRLADGETLDDLLPEAFAACREAGRRFLKMRHYDVQLMGGMVLHGGNIAEMVTGEGKTLVATLAAYLNALEGKGVHVVTVNDYLARRDAEWMSPLYNGLGMTVGAIQSDMESTERQDDLRAATSPTARTTSSASTTSATT